MFVMSLNTRGCCQVKVGIKVAFYFQFEKKITKTIFVSLWSNFGKGLVFVGCFDASAANQKNVSVFGQCD